MSSLISMFSAVAELFIIILIGWLLANSRLWRVGKLEVSFWKPLAGFVYFICVPCIMITKLDKLTWEANLGWYISAVLIGVILSALIGVIISNLFGFSLVDKKTIQAFVFKSNCIFLGFPLLEGLMGEEGLALAIIFAGFAAPTMLIMSIFLFSGIKSAQEQEGLLGQLKESLKHIAQDPVVLGCACGLFLGLIPWDLPKIASTPMSMIGSLTPTLALLIVGSKIKVDQWNHDKKALLVSSATKLVLIPLILWGLISLLPMNETQMQAYILLMATPVAASSVLVAEQYGGNTLLNANAIGVSTVFSLITLTALAFLLI